MTQERREIPQYDLGPMAVRVLQVIVLGALSRPNSLIIDPHCCTHMIERDYSTPDLLYLLETGDYKQYEPEWDTKHKNWLYFVVGTDLDDRRLKVLFVVEDCGSKIMVISAQRHSKGEAV